MKTYSLYLSGSPFPAMSGELGTLQGFARYIKANNPVIVPAGELSSRFPDSLSAGDMLIIDGVPLPIVAIVRNPQHTEVIGENGNRVRLENWRNQLVRLANPENVENHTLENLAIVI